MEWRKNIPSSIKNHLELQIKEASKYKKYYLKSKNPSNAQLWCAIANLSKQNFDLNLKVKFLEGVLRDTLQKQSDKIKTNPIKKSLKKY